MDEFMLINKIKPKYYKQSSLIKGIGDDAAVFQTMNTIVTAVDTFVEGIHFSRETMSYYHVGYRSLAANVSDIAAMGAIPSYYMLSIVIPPKMSEVDILQIYKGLNAIAEQYEIDLIGGDTVTGETLTISITIFGEADNKESVRYRHHAKEGDLVFVTGSLGDACCGLYLLQNNLSVKDDEYFIKRHRMPTPRVHFAQTIRSLPRVSLNDISDGIASELSEIAEASNVSIYIEDDKVPIHSSLNQFTEEKIWNWKYFGGEDFELVGTTSIDNKDKLLKAAKASNIDLSFIGYVEGNKGNVHVKKENQYYMLEKNGYVHLK